ncbi:glycosyl hydrolase family 62-domain-containing protein [Aspergillus alliaceus]|uniref:Alpha-L-arabinofuranosidase n=1 Tax=Petromyces alliaceus TaxID=209559 RepID=A0A5N7CB83_PETAA|nr:glycosyl hydrolase family 62-domain-containing protein [Aspergillus alliaceus]
MSLAPNVLLPFLLVPTVVSLPSSFRWKSSGPLIGPKDDGRNIVGIKDLSIVEVNGNYHVFRQHCHKIGLQSLPPKNFFSDIPSIISQNIGNSNWVDIHLYHSQTPLSNFPNGMTNKVIALSDPKKNRFFEASTVYCAGKGRYLLVVALDGGRSSLADTEANPFARSNNVVFNNGNAWTKSTSHGEMVRSQTDQTMSIGPCSLRYLCQGLDPSASRDCNLLPWRLSLLTKTNSAC